MTSTPTTERRGTRVKRPVVATRRTGPGRLNSTATAWLAHPLASFFLVAVVSALLLIIGTVMVWSASSVYAFTQFKNAYYFIQRQVVFLVIGLIVVVITQWLPLGLLRRLGWVFFGIAGVLMCLTFVPGLGYGVKGNKNWLNFSTESMIRLQPSEIAKVAIILWAATLFTTKRTYLDDPRHLLVPLVPGASLMIGLTVLQHDLGTAIIMGMILVAILWNVGASWRVMLSIAVTAAAGALVLALTSADRLRRILGFFSPGSDLSGTNYQPNQAQYGLATGGWWGVGLGASRQKWGSLSEAHTDYVLAIIGEETGLVGTLIVLALLVLLGYAGFRIALRSGTFYARMVAAGISSWLMIQAIVNVFVVLRLLPVLGVPLPLVSYGGSSLVVNMIGVGLLLACAKDEPEAKEFLERRRRSEQPRGRLSAVLGGRRRHRTEGS